MSDFFTQTIIKIFLYIELTNFISLISLLKMFQKRKIQY